MKIIQISGSHNEIWALTDTGEIYVRMPNGTWKELTENFPKISPRDIMNDKKMENLANVAIQNAIKSDKK